MTAKETAFAGARRSGGYHKERAMLLKEFALLLVALLIVPAALAAEDAVVASAEASDPLLPAEWLRAESPALSSTAADAAAAAPTKIESSAPVCQEICRCLKLQTPPVTKVGATCLRARQNAAAAARVLAVCPPNSTGPCGPPTSHKVDPCVSLPTGGFSATAVATFHCEFCVLRCR